MREILFRAKREATNDWVYGYFEKAYDDFQIYVSPKIITKRGSEYVCEDTLGQFTGLTDKNGVKIFEGDILQGDEYPYCSEGNYNYYAEVVWFDEGCCGAGLYTHKNPKSTVRGISHGNCEWIEDFDSDNWEVIGNIYDNPELIGEDGEQNGSMSRLDKEILLN